MTIYPVDTTGSVRDVFDEIVKERIAQDEKWGGSPHDDMHSIFDWVKFIRYHANRAVGGRAKDDYRKQMIRVAALAIAAIQAYDRKVGPRELTI